MVLMAWDHVSGFWNPGHRGSEGLLGNRTVYPDFTQFLLRFITHYCAPIFIFLAGTSLALSTHKRLSTGAKQKEISYHIFKRGVVLILLAVFVESPAFGASPLYFGVISCIGLCFIIFSFYRRLPTLAILTVSILIIVAHPFLNLSWIPDTNPAGYYLRVILHEPSFQRYPYEGLYPIIPWIGVMGLGWCFGTFLLTYDWSNTIKLIASLVGAGAGLLSAWFIVRLFNGFGNLVPRTGETLEDWLFVSKYPPDLAFILWTLGGMSFLLALGLALQRWKGFEKGIAGVILSFGRVPLFFYLAHLWFYRLRPVWMTRPPFQLDLLSTGVFWIVGLTILWRLCLRYERIKSAHPDSLLKYI
ncbi:DUF1624 domain-containing protein [Candidatus Bathyarchaeota archaeon]|nr:DUF1624 domain-containing protein [Candidatus Bathyarchaeota archaeon]MBS7630848.1 DUF1624 domain-containing protein [Candidatus Bathyarchaeota archaeon]